MSLLLTGLFLPRSFFIEFMTDKQGEFFSTGLPESHQLRREGSSGNIYGTFKPEVDEYLDLTLKVK
jgi:hypothetical protein